ncbi:hypothetical protein OIO90_004664 [Microbotryomycetes sp. JL221]|nr:hypothetical protein OIO90_004664 [Microbotryomycetes sp. JL221]
MRRIFGASTTTTTSSSSLSDPSDGRMHHSAFNNNNNNNNNNNESSSAAASQTSYEAYQSMSSRDHEPYHQSYSHNDASNRAPLNQQPTDSRFATNSTTTELYQRPTPYNQTSHDNMTQSSTTTTSSARQPQAVTQLGNGLPSPYASRPQHQHARTFSSTSFDTQQQQQQQQLSPRLNPTTSSSSRNVSATNTAFTRALSPTSDTSQHAPKDTVMVELLSGQAELEAKDFEILDWEQMQALKKEHSQLASKIASLTRSLALETRLKDSAAKLVRLSGPQSNNNDGAGSSSSSSSKPRVTREQAEQQVVMATTKMDQISNEMYKLGWKESELRTRLLRHTAGVLALALKRREDEDKNFWSGIGGGGGGTQTPIQSGATVAVGSSFTSSPPPTAGSYNGFGSFTSPYSVAGSINSRSRQTSDRFEGPHLFAGNKDATFVNNNNNTFISPLGSPAFVATSEFVNSQQDELGQSKIKQLETQVEELKRELQDAKDEIQNVIQSHDVTKSNDKIKLEQTEIDLRDQIDKHELTKNELNYNKRQHDDVKLELEQMRYEIEDVREELKQTQNVANEATHELNELRQTSSNHDTHRQDFESELQKAQDLTQEASDKARQAELQLAQTEHRTIEAETRVEQLEKALEQAQTELTNRQSNNNFEQDDNDNESNAKRQVSSLLVERSKITQAIADVLNRHRKGSPLASAFKDLPTVQDQIDDDESQDLPSYLASTVDAHFEQAATQFEHLSTELAMSSDINHNNKYNNNEEELYQLQQELRHVSDERDHLQIELETHQLEKENSEQNQIQLEQKLKEQIKDLNLFDQTKQNLESCENELNLAKNRIIELENQLQQHVEVNEDNKSKHEADVDKALQETRETRTSLETAQKQLAELEERLANSGDKEASMLERLNELNENLEQVRSEKRSLQTRLETLESDKTNLSTQLMNCQNEIQQLKDQTHDVEHIESLKDQIQDLKDEIIDLQEELQDSKSRETKNRAQLLEELSSVQSELSRTKTSLKQAERKLGRGGTTTG